jgi:Protein of unknown function (DUF3251)
VLERGFVWNVALSIVSYGLMSCQQTAPPSAPNTPVLTAPASIPPETQARINVLEQNVRTMNTRLYKLEAFKLTQEGAYQTGTFDPTESTFQRIDAPSGFGSFAVSVKDVQAFGDGVRVQINFGNLTTAAFSGVTLKMRYGPRAPDMSDAEWAGKYDLWNAALKTKELSLTQDLHPGSWNPVNVTLPGIAADRFGYLELSLNTTSVSLTKR